MRHLVACQLRHNQRRIDVTALILCHLNHPKHARGRQVVNGTIQDHEHFE